MVVQLVVVNGYFEVVLVFKKVGVVLDGIFLYYVVVRDYYYVVEYLLKEGVRDVCIDLSFFIELFRNEY